jgi:hypothetical protein
MVFSYYQKEEKSPREGNSNQNPAFTTWPSNSTPRKILQRI